jgi:hypothetical protein
MTGAHYFQRRASLHTFSLKYFRVYCYFIKEHKPMPVTDTSRRLRPDYIDQDIESLR